MAKKLNGRIKDVSIQRSDKSETIDSSKWFKADISMLKDILLKDDNIILVSNENKIEIQDLVDCYVENITSTFSKNQEMDPEVLVNTLSACVQTLEN